MGARLGRVPRPVKMAKVRIFKRPRSGMEKTGLTVDSRVNPEFCDRGVAAVIAFASAGGRERAASGQFPRHLTFAHDPDISGLKMLPR